LFLIWHQCHKRRKEKGAFAGPIPAFKNGDMIIKIDLGVWQIEPIDQNYTAKLAWLIRFHDWL